MTEFGGEKIILDSVLIDGILGKMFAGVCVVDLKDLLVKYTSPRFEELFGLSPNEFLGQTASVIGLSVEKNTGRLSKEFFDNIKKNSCWIGELKNTKKDGSLLYCQVKFCFIKHEKYGDLLLGIFLDITGRKIAEENVKEKLKELEKVNKLMIGRELKMVDLKEKIKKLEKKK